jgi:hypothetical protein
MFMAMRSMTRRRDEQWIEFGLRVLMNVLLNFSIGLAMALVMFIIGKMMDLLFGILLLQSAGLLFF